MARLGSERADGDWCKELRGLKGDPVLLLLGAVFLRAKADAKTSWRARRFVERVKTNCGEESAGFAVVMAMRRGPGRCVCAEATCHPVGGKLPPGGKKGAGANGRQRPK